MRESDIKEALASSDREVCEAVDFEMMKASICSRRRRIEILPERSKRTTACPFPCNAISLDVGGRSAIVIK